MRIGKTGKPPVFFLVLPKKLDGGGAMPKIKITAAPTLPLQRRTKEGSDNMYINRSSLLRVFKSILR